MLDENKPILNILVPTDFTNNAFHALRYAAELLKNRECNIYLLNVYNERNGFRANRIKTDSGTLSRELANKSSRNLENTFNRVKKKNENPKHSYILISESNNLMEVIHSMVDKLEIDLIILGNKGEKSSIPLFLEGIATQNLRSVKKYPVLTVPKSAKIDIPREIAFATDFKKPFNANAINPIRSLALLCGATIRIVHIQEKEGLDTIQKVNLESILSYFEPVPCTIDKMPHFISKAKVLQIYLEDTDIEMFAIINYEYAELEKMLREPIVEKMLKKIDIPYFIVPDIETEVQ